MKKPITQHLFADDNLDICWKDAVQAMPENSTYIVRSRDQKRQQHLLSSVRGMRIRKMWSVPNPVLRSKIDGFHVPSHYLRCAAKLGYVRRSGANVSAACHSVQDLQKAQKLGCIDYCYLSPVFFTKSHPDQKGIGLCRARTLVRQAKLPIFLLGGIVPHRVIGYHIQAAGVAGIHNFVAKKSLQHYKC